MLSLARVVQIQPESNSVDIEFMDDGRRVAGVKCMVNTAGTDFGNADLSRPDNIGYGSGRSKTRDIIAVVGFLNSFPIVMGFLFPEATECLFADRNRKIYRHASDVYYSIDGAGNTELAHPSGAFIRMGVTPQHEDLTGKDYDSLWKIKRNTGNAVHIHIEQAGGAAAIDIDPAGNIVVTNIGNTSITSKGNISMASEGNISLAAKGSLSISAQGGISSTAQGSMAIKAAAIETTSSMHITGGITSDADIVAGSISLIHHTHPDPQGGNTSPPV